MIEFNYKNLVSVRQIIFEEYPSNPPFDPQKGYIELGSNYCSENNLIYEAVRSLLTDLKLDINNINTIYWNPFKDLIKPGNLVVIKPNLVLDAENQDAVTTHGSVIRPIIDYVWKALNGTGKIIICDAPVVFADFDRIVDRNGIKKMVEVLKSRGYNIELIDLRSRKILTKNNIKVNEFVDFEKEKDAEICDLKNTSFFEDDKIKLSKLSYGDYSNEELVKNHLKGHHKYKISKLILKADVVISIPKLKTHKKSGLSCCLKNLVGINVDKDYLPHFTLGPANLGGDEFPQIAFWRIPILIIFKLLRFLLLGKFRKYSSRTVSSILGLLNLFKFKVDKNSPVGKVDTAQRLYQLITGTDYAGSWEGNETIWRMILDLNRIFLYADANGKIQDTIQRRVFYLVDGFISGVRNGPLTPHVIKPGIVAAGYNAAIVDDAILIISGIYSANIPLYREALASKNSWLNENLLTNIILNGKEIQQKNFNPIVTLYEPSFWNYYK